MNYLVYITTNLINGRKYIGSHSTKNINDSYLGSGVYLAKAIKKYGRENFEKEIIGEGIDVKDMLGLEEYYINYYGASKSPLFYNISEKGYGSKHTEESRKKLSDHRKGKPNHNKGKKQSVETCLKKSISMKGKIQHSEEWKINHSNLTKGKPKLMLRGIPNVNRDKTIYTFYNNTKNKTFTGIRNSFINEFKLNPVTVCNIIKEKQNSVKGWKLVK